ncbi:MAG: M50 family metallopeptidase [Bernardetiaceae bacterium]|nr:M50 family metallopeptidase [Bernardetiaceae bacterium]
MNYYKNTISDESPEQTSQSSLYWLIGIGIFTVVVWNLPFGRTILYPFQILGTWFHEMGHGLTAIFTGERFIELQMFPNGSGFARHTSGGRIANAIIAAGGLLAPPIVGAAFIIAGRTRRTARIALGMLAFMLVLSVIIWVRSLFGVLAVSAFGAIATFLALKSPKEVQQFTIQFLGIQAWASTYLSLDYMFSPGANVGGQSLPSDTMAIQQSLFLPYWFWGALIALCSVALLVVSLRIAFKENFKGKS